MIPKRMREEWVQRHGSPCEVVCGMTEYVYLTSTTPYLKHTKLGI
jgi:hypothetical protein